MKKQREFNDNIIRSGARMRESVRSLPKGHFQQIRQMFDKQLCSTKKLSTIYERQQTSVPSHVVLHLPVTDDEKLKHTTTTIKIDNDKKSLEEHYRDYLAEYQAFRLKLTNEFLQHKKLYPNKFNEHLLKQSISLPHENHLNEETLSYSKSSPQEFSLFELEESILTTTKLNKHNPLSMSAAINYTDSYDSSISNHLNRTGSSRQYVSSLQRTLTAHNKPILVTTPVTCTPLKRNNQPITSNGIYDKLQPSRRLHSATSLSSTGYDSNSSPSIKSKRNSLATNNSNDFIIHSAYSSSSSASSNDEHHQQLSKPWIQNESNTINSLLYNDEIYESSNEPSPLINRTQTKLNQSTLEHHPIHNSSLIDSSSSSSSSSSPVSIHEPIIIKKKTNTSSYVLQTTSFPDNSNEQKDKTIHRWNNIHTERVDINNTQNKNRKHPLTYTKSTGFQVMNVQQQQQQSKLTVLNSVTEQKQINEREDSPLPIVENPVFNNLPPKKPPRTFQHDNNLTKINDKKLQSSSSSNNTSPTFDLGTRSISCMDLTADVSNVLLSSGLLPLEHEHNRILPQSNNTFDKTKKNFKVNENIYEELKSPSSTMKQITNTQQYLNNNSQTKIQTIDKNNVILRTPIIKTKISHTTTTTTIKTNMKKGTSEPNLTKTSRSKSPFSPRGLIDRFKRILPTSLSKQSLNEKPINQNDNITINDSDDSASTSSETNDNLRTSRLDHVSRIKNIYDTLNTSNLFIDPNFHTTTNELTKTLYNYVVHILPEQEFGYFSNGNGCLSSSNININQQQISSSSSIRFKYPLDANDEVTLKYFCFPDQYDSNNNPLLLIKKTTQEYFRFTLTNMHGIRQYGYCSRFFHKGTINALCIVSPYDLIEIYEKILSTATELFLSYKDEDARNFLKEIYSHSLPNRGDTIHIHTTTVGLYTLKCEYDRRKELIDSVTLLSLSTETIIKIFSSILYEQKLIFISNDLGRLTRLINTFTCLLYPFSWPHTYVPVLPALMLDVIQAPTPYIIGILRSCESYLTGNDDLLSQDNSDILIVDIDNDRVRSINDYLTTTNSIENFTNHNLLSLNSDNSRFQILPKIFKIELKQEISLLRKTKTSLSLDECQQRLRDVFMSIFIQSCYNYKDYFNNKNFQREEFVQSKQHTIELFLEWFTRTQIFELYIRKKSEFNHTKQFAITFDLACEKYMETISKQIPPRVTVKSVKRKSATRIIKQDHHRF